MKSKLLICGLVLGLSCRVLAGQNIATNSAGCAPLTISGNSSQTVTMNGQSYSNVVTNSSAAQKQVSTLPAEIQASQTTDAQSLELLIQKKMAAFEAKKATYDSQLAAYQASGSKSRSAYRSLVKQAAVLAEAEAELDALIADYDSLSQ